MPGRAARFALVGAVGFVIDCGLLTALSGTMGPYAARLPSFASAVTVTWALNRRITFGPSGRRPAAEGALYAAVQVAGAAANLAVYAGMLHAFPGLAPYPPVPFAAGAAAGLAVNLAGSTRLVFRLGRDARPGDQGTTKRP